MVAISGSGISGHGTARQMLTQLRQQGHHQAADDYKAKYLARMWDLSGFMKLLKQRFTQWFNQKQGRKGTLWEERFKSVLVEDGHAARVMAMENATMNLRRMEKELVLLRNRARQAAITNELTEIVSGAESLG